jgi:hypothetical protein
VAAAHAVLARAVQDAEELALMHVLQKTLQEGANGPDRP